MKCSFPSRNFDLSFAMGLFWILGFLSDVLNVIFYFFKPLKYSLANSLDSYQP